MVTNDIKHGLLLATLSGLALATLVHAGPRAAPEDQMVEQSSPPARLPEILSGDFTRIHQGEKWLISYQINSFSQRPKISCTVEIQKAQQLIDNFSYQNTERAKYILTDVKRQFKKEWKGFTSFGEPRFSLVTEKDGTVNIKPEWRLKEDKILTAADYDYAMDDQKKFDTWLEGKTKDAERDFMKNKGFLYDPDQGWIFDYAKLVHDATPALSECTQEFSHVFSKAPEALMEFFQTKVRFKQIKDEHTGWTTGGVRPPPSVLLQAEGDCDSKAITFCVLHQNDAKGLIILRSYRKIGNKAPGHAFVGVESYSLHPKPLKAWPIKYLKAGVYKKPVFINNRYFTPCELAGPGSSVYGKVTKTDDYKIIPISVH